MTKLISIAAVAENGTIGVDNSLPWYYPEDLQHYKNTTYGNPLIMGRKTYDTIDGYMEGRTPHIVITSQELDTPDEVIVVNSIDEAMSQVEKLNTEKLFVIGGETIYRQLMPYVDELIITHIPGEYDGDTYFPDWNNNDWEKLSEEQLTEELTVVHYKP